VDENGRTYVYAYADGSGIQLVHLSYGTSRTTANKTAGTGSNTLTASPSSYTNTSPNLVCHNYCADTNLLLAGTADTSGLAQTIKDYSDGYQATLSVGLEYFNGGAQGAWRGACMVYYSSQFIHDNTNGAVCAAAQQSSTAGAGPFDFGGITLMHVTPSVWSPPAMTGAVVPSATALADANYGITSTPAAIAHIYTQGYYASTSWYQPKYASSYTLVGRYGRSDYAGAYCIQGSGSSSSFSAPRAGIALTGAFALSTSFAIVSALGLAF